MRYLVDFVRDYVGNFKVRSHAAFCSRARVATPVRSGRYDVILTADSASADVHKLLAPVQDAAIVLAVEELAKNRTILQAIDKAVAQRDQNLKRTRSRSS